MGYGAGADSDGVRELHCFASRAQSSGSNAASFSPRHEQKGSFIPSSAPGLPGLRPLPAVLLMHSRGVRAGEPSHAARGRFAEGASARSGQSHGRAPSACSKDLAVSWVVSSSRSAPDRPHRIGTHLCLGTGGGMSSIHTCCGFCGASSFCRWPCLGLRDSSSSAGWSTLTHQWLRYTLRCCEGGTMGSLVQCSFGGVTATLPARGSHTPLST